MIIKSMSRKGGDSCGPVIRYVLRYVLTEKEPNEKEKGHMVAPQQLSKRDIAKIKELYMDKGLLEDISDKGLEANHHKYFQKHLVAKLNREAEELDDTKGKNWPKGFLLRHNIRGKEINEIVKEFDRSYKERAFQRKDAVAVTHLVISWATLDSAKITDKMLKDMGRYFIQQYGEDKRYIATAHRNTSTVHMHFCIASGNLQNRSARISIETFEKVKCSVQEYQMQKYPELSHSVVEFDKSKKKEINTAEVKISKIRDATQSVKNDLSAKCDTALASAQSIEEFLQSLRQAGYMEYSRTGGVVTGVKAPNGLKFRFSTLGVSLEELYKKEQKHLDEEKRLVELRDMREKGGRSKRQIELIQDTSDVNAFEEVDLSDLEKAQLEQLQVLRNGNEQQKEREVAEYELAREEQEGNTAHEVEEKENDSEQKKRYEAAEILAIEKEENERRLRHEESLQRDEER